MDRDNSAQGAVRRSAPKPLTATAIANLRAGKTLADGAIRPGAGSLKIRKRQTAGGVVCEWLFEYRRDGKPVRQSMGRYSVAPAEGCLTQTQARERAVQLQAMVRNGEDPVARRAVERHETKVAQAAAVASVREAQDKTLAAMLRAYVAGLRSRDKHDSAYDAENMFTNHVERAFPDLAELPAASIRPEHVTRILSRLVGTEVEDKKGRTALKLRSYMAAAFKQALGASTDPMAPASAAGFGLTSNPAAAVPATTMAAKFNRAGDRVLSAEELRRYIAHVDALPSSLQRLALRLQLATGGQRIRQLLRLTEDDIAAKSLMLYDPKGKRQEARRHELPLIAEVVELVDAVIELSQADDESESPVLFSARGAPMAAETLSAAVHDISAAMVEAGEAATPFSGRDIRRTVETVLGERLDVNKDTRAQLLSHGLSGVQDRHYDRGAYLKAKTVALRKWNDYLADLCIGHPEESRKVAPMRRSA